MKYQRLLFLPLLLLIASCGPVVDNPDQEKINNEITLIENSKKSTSVIENFVVSQNNIKYREIYESKQYDSINNRTY